MTTLRSFAAVVIVLSLPMAASAQSAAEYAIKASYMARFAEFVEWPEGAGENDDSRVFVVSVIGDAPFRDIFERTFAALKVESRSVEVRYISSVEDSEGSQILFVTRSEKKRLEQITAFTRDKPILTVSDTEGFAKQGVIINFYQERENVRFEINPSAAKDTDLRISSLLLSNARIVKGEKDKR